MHLAAQLGAVNMRLGVGGRGGRRRVNIGHLPNPLTPLNPSDKFNAQTFLRCLRWGMSSRVKHATTVVLETVLKCHFWFQQLGTYWSWMSSWFGLCFLSHGSREQPTILGVYRRAGLKGAVHLKILLLSQPLREELVWQQRAFVCLLAKLLKILSRLWWHVQETLMLGKETDDFVLGMFWSPRELWPSKALAFDHKAIYVMQPCISTGYICYTTGTS